MMRGNGPAALLAVLLLVTACDSGKPERAPAVAELAATLEQFRAKSGLPALAAAVWKGRDLVAMGAVGVRKQGESSPVTAADRWHLGSDTKAMTATLTGMLVDRGKLRFEDRLGSVLADVPMAPGYTEVTIEQLLQHRAGMPHDFPEDIMKYLRDGGDIAVSRASAVRSFLQRPPTSPPGAYGYSNVGYVILGHVLERITDISWENMMQKELFAKLGMDACGFGPPGSRDKPDQPWGHTSIGGTLHPIPPEDPRSDNPPAYGPAGRAHCPLSDWGRFLGMQLHNDGSMLSKIVMDRLHKPPTDGDYAGGWFVTERDWAGGRALTHAGSNTLWYAVTWLAPHKDLVFAVVTNGGGDAAARAADDVCGALIGIYAGR